MCSTVPRASEVASCHGPPTFSFGCDSSASLAAKRLAFSSSVGCVGSGKSVATISVLGSSDWLLSCSKEVLLAFLSSLTICAGLVVIEGRPGSCLSSGAGGIVGGGWGSFAGPYR